MAYAKTIEQKKEDALARVAASNAPEEQKGKFVKRRIRGSFNGTQSKLSVSNIIPGYHMHVFNDEPGRVQQALDNGYEFVEPEEIGGTSAKVVSNNTDVGSKVRYLVGTDGVGEPKYGFLMKIKQEWYDEDQALLQQRNDKTDAAIRSGKFTASGHSAEGLYDAGTKIK
jgi:hypothetical protein